MKEQTFLVKLTFADKIVSDDDLQEITFKIADALVNTVNAGNGLAPNQSDTYTTGVKVISKMNPDCQTEFAEQGKYSMELVKK